MTGPDPKADGELMREAATWFARMRGPDADASRAEFEAWLVRGALHRAAYNRVAEIFAMGKILAEPAAERRAPGAAPAPAAASWNRTRVATLAAALFALFAGAWLVARLAAPGTQTPPPVASLAPPTSFELATGPGGSRTVTLPDGSLARLGDGARLTVRFAARRRDIALASGSVRFEVRHDGRPFIVRAGGGAVIARGTIFEVSRQAHEPVRVRLLEGAVDVHLPGAPGAARAIRRLAPGESLSFAPRETGAASEADSPAAMTGPAGASIRDLDDIRLAELIADANRTASRPIRLADPLLGQRRVSGRLRVDDPERLADHLAMLLGLGVDRSDPETLTLRPD